MTEQKHQGPNPVNRICYVTNQKGDLLQVVSDEPIRFFIVTEDLDGDRVYELTPGVGVLCFGNDSISDCLRDDQIGHYFDCLEQPSYGSR